jgi:lysozyme
MIVPKSKPQIAESDLREKCSRVAVRLGIVLPPVFFAAIRGYYSETFSPTGNNIGVYDDAIFIITPEKIYSYNGNTDPSRNRFGMATLLPGWHLYRKGNHGITRPGGGYPAFRPATPEEKLPVRRHGEPKIPSSRPGIAINIHRGGQNGTSSEGCQTIHPDQWAEFYLAATTEMDRLSMTKIGYLLME